MQRRHRAVHRWLWPILAILALGIVVVSVQVRPEYSALHSSESTED